jgi:5-methylcytosine-specific restriction enzyme A
MVFKPDLEKNQVIDNNDLCSIFNCNPQGGMRRSLTTNTLIVVSNRTTDFYKDEWKDSVLHYVGMGLKGDQSLSFRQNKTLNHSQTNGIRVHLFEVLKKGRYTYRGEVKLVGQPYNPKEGQPDVEGHNRLVWIFPLKLI